ncbi:RPA-interacting protein A [Nymphon striatum]|nr:RPA-interacting protein A [Nymphon striatum]
MEGIEKHKAMYKRKNSPWRDVYRQRCLEQVKKGRQRLIDRFRNIEPDFKCENGIMEVMAQEWEALKSDHNLPSLHSGIFDSQLLNDSSEDEADEEIISFIDMVKEELLETEKQIILEYEKNTNFTNNAVNNFHSDAVTCPICKKNPLMLNNGILFCTCGIRLNTEQDCISMSNIKEQLKLGMTSHNSGCCAEPNFSVSRMFEMSNIVLTCSICDFIFIVV